MTAPIAEPLVPTTGRERVRQALRVTEWMLRVIDAPKDLSRWPRKDRDAWMAVVGRPRIREVMARLQQPPVQQVDEAGAIGTPGLTMAWNGEVPMPALVQPAEGSP